MHKHVAVMPDVHAGYSSTVGSVATIIPKARGVDTDCGMMALRLPLTAKVCLMTCQPRAFPLQPKSLTDERTGPLRHQLTHNRWAVSKPLGFESSVHSERWPLAAHPARVISRTPDTSSQTTEPHNIKHGAYYC